MSTHAFRVSLAGLVLGTFVLSLLLLPKLPARVVTHWNVGGQPDGWMERDAGTLFMPAVMACLAILFVVIPSIDPLRKNIDAFRGHYHAFVVGFTALLAVLQGHLLAWNLGYRVNPLFILPLAFGALLFWAGELMHHAKRNWFVGIRTPWTLSSDRVWDQTHRVGGWLFKASGVLSVVGAPSGRYWVWFGLGPVLASSVFLIAYSYALYQREQTKR